MDRRKKTVKTFSKSSSLPTRIKGWICLDFRIVQFFFKSPVVQHMPLYCAPSTNFNIQPILSPNRGFNPSDKQRKCVCLCEVFSKSLGKSLFTDLCGRTRKCGELTK